MPEIKGTSCFLAPELWTGDASYNENIDIFALGIMLLSSSTFAGLERGDTPENSYVSSMTDAESAMVWASGLERNSQVPRPGWSPLKDLALYMVRYVCSASR